MATGSSKSLATKSLGASHTDNDTADHNHDASPASGTSSHSHEANPASSASKALTLEDLTSHGHDSHAMPATSAIAQTPAPTAPPPAPAAASTTATTSSLDNLLGTQPLDQHHPTV